MIYRLKKKKKESNNFSARERYTLDLVRYREGKNN
jgi:hypothetical protein